MNLEEISKKCIEDMHQKMQKSIVDDIKREHDYKMAFKKILEEKGSVTWDDLEKELYQPQMPIWRRAFECMSESGKPTEKDIWFIDESEHFLVKIPAGSTTAQCLILRELEQLPKEEGL